MAKLLEVDPPQGVTDLIAPYQGNFATLEKGVDDEALGRSRGAFSTKIYIAVDALSNPVEIILTAGQEADVMQAEPLIEAHKADAYILDKAYDSDAVVNTANRQGGEAVIPPKKNRKVPRDYHKHLYK